MITLKLIHISSVVISGASFFTRGIWMLRESSLLQARWVKIAPHFVDATLLFSALGLAWQTRQYPFVHGWLTAKIFGLIAYIILGTIALKRGMTKSVRVAAWISAMLVFSYIVWVAVAHNPAPFLNA